MLCHASNKLRAKGCPKSGAPVYSAGPSSAGPSSAGSSSAGPSSAAKGDWVFGAKAPGDRLVLRAPPAAAGIVPGSDFPPKVLGGSSGVPTIASASATPPTAVTQGRTLVAAARVGGYTHRKRIMATMATATFMTELRIIRRDLDAAASPYFSRR